MNIILGKLILLFVLLIVLMKCRLNLSWSMGITILAGFVLFKLNEKGFISGKSKRIGSFFSLKSGWPGNSTESGM